MSLCPSSETHYSWPDDEPSCRCPIRPQDGVSPCYGYDQHHLKRSGSLKPSTQSQSSTASLIPEQSIKSSQLYRQDHSIISGEPVKSILILRYDHGSPLQSRELVPEMISDVPRDEPWKEGLKNSTQDTRGNLTGLVSRCERHHCLAGLWSW